MSGFPYPLRVQPCLFTLLTPLQSWAHYRFMVVTGKQVIAYRYQLSTTRITTYTQLSTAHMYLRFRTPHTTRTRSNLHSAPKADVPSMNVYNKLQNYVQEVIKKSAEKSMRASVNKCMSNAYYSHKTMRRK